MSSDKFENRYYPEASLIIEIGCFWGYLEEQITEGNELLETDVPLSDVYVSNSGYLRVSSSIKKSKYDETAKNAFIDHYNRWNNRNKTLYRTSFDVPDNIYYHEYISEIGQIWGDDIIKEYKDQIRRLINHLKGDVERSSLFKIASSVISDCNNETNKSLSIPMNDSKDIFIVHGHNEEMKQFVARIVTKLGLNPIILHEQINGGKTIIDKFEANAAKIRFAIILLSADDMAASVKDLKGVDDKDLRTKLEMRARQNVVFEMGYFAGKLGRANMFYLLQDGVAKPGDLDGLVYTPYDKRGAWRFELVKELKACGYNVDANNIL